MRKDFKERFIGEFPCIPPQVDEKDWTRCLRCRELEPRVNQDWPLKGLCMECVQIESNFYHNPS